MVISSKLCHFSTTIKLKQYFILFEWLYWCDQCVRTNTLVRIDVRFFKCINRRPWNWRVLTYFSHELIRKIWIWREIKSKPLTVCKCFNCETQTHRDIFVIFKATSAFNNTLLHYLQTALADVLHKLYWKNTFHLLFYFLFCLHLAYLTSDCYSFTSATDLMVI